MWMKIRHFILILLLLLAISVVSANNCIITIVSDISCNSSADGALQAIPPSGTVNPSYQWDSNAQNQSSDIASGLSAGTYAVTITDDLGNTCTCATSLTQPDSLLVSIAATNVSQPCVNGSDGSATASSTGGTPPYNYFWSNGATTTSISSLFTGLYKLTVTDANNCQSIETILITEPKSLDLNISLVKNTNCFGSSDGSALAFVGGGTPPYSYLWDSGETTSTATALNAGIHLVRVTESSGCVEYGFIEITEPDFLSIAILSTNVSCKDFNDGSATINITGGTSPYNYVWSNNQTSNPASNLAPGNYFATITDDNGCSATGAVQITAPDQISVTLENDSTSCSGFQDGNATATPVGGTPPYSYLWSDGQASQTASNLGAGNWQVTVTDANLCTITGVTTIGQPLLLVPAINTTNPTCGIDPDGSADAIITNGVPPFTYAWNTGATTTSITGLSAGSYTVSITDQNGCCAITSTIISLPECDSCDLANQGLIDICTIIADNPNSPLVTEDCDGGGVINVIECNTGYNPTDYADDCTSAEVANLDICANILLDNNHPLAAQDCDNGGISNLLECQAQTDPFDASDDCMAPIQSNLNICAIINFNPQHPLATLDCDQGGVDNYTECLSGENPSTPSDDCRAAVAAGLDICQIIGKGNHPWSTLDCDLGGVDNQTECDAGNNPSNPADDATCPKSICEVSIDNGYDICLLLSTGPNSELATLDCDNGGVNNQTECANGGNPSNASDDCMLNNTIDLCTLLANNPDHPSGTIDCDNGGIDNLTECEAGTDPLDTNDDCLAAIKNSFNICMLIQFDINHPFVSQDCDGGGISNWIECLNGGNPLLAADDCDPAIQANVDICQLLITDPSNPLASLDCDGGGVDNQTECQAGNNPSVHSDDCAAALNANLDICAMIAGQANHPLAEEDCDGGGISNSIECANNGNPADPSDDCQIAISATTDICTLLFTNPKQPLANEDCDSGGISNLEECMAGTNPADPTDDCEAAIQLEVNICLLIDNNPGIALATVDCDNGGVPNSIECLNGGNPSDPNDECIAALATQTDICLLINKNSDHPLALLDCDNGGVDNITECLANSNPLEASDECVAAISANLNICQLIAFDSTHPMATLDCDQGGVDNYTECVEGGSDPADSGDDCSAAVQSGLDICAIINNDPTHPWATLDCDQGGVDNITECNLGADPSQPADDPFCLPNLCEQSELDEIDLCAYINANPLDSIRFADCDGGGLPNYLECIFGSDLNDPTDDCSTAIGANISVCSFINNDPDHPFSNQDCDNGGINNFIECSVNRDPRNPNDDCLAAIDDTINICQLIVFTVAHPLATKDCDNGGIDNYTECINGNDPLDSEDDCLLAVDEQIDICMILANSPVFSPLQFEDCDGDGVTNSNECADTTNPIDPCSYQDTSITLPVTADQSECLSTFTDLSPVSTIVPGNIAGSSSVGYAVQVTELNGLDTDGSPIQVRIPSDPRFVFTWDPNLMSVAFTQVNNIDWLYQGNGGGIFHTFRYIGNGGAMTANQVTAFGFQAVYDPQSTSGQTTITATIVPFSGGEDNLFNNSDSERLVYFE